MEREEKPLTAADLKRREVRARGAGQVRKNVESAPTERTVERWVDEGPVDERGQLRRAAEGATSRGRQGVERPARRDNGVELDPDTAADVERLVEPRRAVKMGDRLKSAQVALERERYGEAKRIAKSCLKEMSGVAAVHEVIGLASYRLGQWREAAAALEIARSLKGRVEDLPVLADCYRAMRRWSEVDGIWREIKDASPSHEIMAEGRIVAAGSQADRGDIREALEIMRKAAEVPKRVREHHLRQWYVIGDLYDRAGNVQKAREFFRRVAMHDRTFADVTERIAAL